MSKAVHRIWYTLLVVGLSIVGGDATVCAAPAGMIHSLKMSGFQVSQGYPKLYTFQDCIDHTYPSLKNCFLANPAAPYVLPVLKLWPDEYEDPAMVNAILETKPGYSATYRLDPREAIVIFGQMPPPGRYMGLQTFEFSQHGNWRDIDYDQWANTPNLPLPIQFLFDTIQPSNPKSHRVVTTSALGDIVNNVVMERKSGYPFGETRYFIITPSDTTDKAVRAALQAQGVPDDHIFTQHIPREDDLGPIGPLGMGKNAIDFLTTFRYAVPENRKDADNWQSTLPLTILRVRASASLGPVKRYGLLTFEPRSANSEADLAEDLNDLIAEVCDSLSRANFTSTDCALPGPVSSLMLEMTYDLGWVGPYCRSIGMDCNADQNDMAFYLSASPLSLDSGQVIAVVGTLATETGNATYVGLAANDASMMAGVTNVLDSDLTDSEGNVIKGLKGSADSYAGTVNNTGKLFVHYFTNKCDIDIFKGVPGWEDTCSQTLGVKAALGDPALQNKFIITLRNYIVPGTQRGADPSKLVTPRTLTFRRRYSHPEKFCPWHRQCFRR
jgi:hypothetical protein